MVKKSERLHRRGCRCRCGCYRYRTCWTVLEVSVIAKVGLLLLLVLGVVVQDNNTGGSLAVEAFSSSSLLRTHNNDRRYHYHHRQDGFAERKSKSTEDERTRSFISALHLESPATEASSYLGSCLSEFVTQAEILAQAVPSCPTPTPTTVTISSTESYLNSLSSRYHPYFARELEQQQQQTHHVAAAGMAASCVTAAAASRTNFYLFDQDEEESFPVALNDEDLFPELEENGNSALAALVENTAEPDLNSWESGSLASDSSMLDDDGLLLDDHPVLIEGDSSGIVPSLGNRGTTTTKKHHWTSRFAAVQFRAMQVGTNYLSRQSSPALLTARRTLDTYKNKWLVAMDSGSTYSSSSLFSNPTNSINSPKLPPGLAVAAGETTTTTGSLATLSDTMESGLQELGSLLVLLLGVLNEEAAVQGGTTTTTSQAFFGNIFRETQNNFVGGEGDTVAPPLTALASKLVMQTCTVVLDLLLVVADSTGSSSGGVDDVAAAAATTQSSNIQHVLQLYASQLTSALAAMSADWGNRNRNSPESIIQVTSTVRSLMMQLGQVMVATATSTASSSAATELLEEVSILSQSI